MFVDQDDTGKCRTLEIRTVIPTHNGSENVMNPDPFFSLLLLRELSWESCDLCPNRSSLKDYASLTCSMAMRVWSESG